MSEHIAILNKNREEKIHILKNKLKKWELAFRIMSILFLIIILSIRFMYLYFLLVHIKAIIGFSVIMVVFFGISTGVLRIKLERLLDEKKDEELQMFFSLSKEEQIEFLRKRNLNDNDNKKLQQ